MPKLYTVALLLRGTDHDTLAASWQLAKTPEDAVSQAVKQAAQQLQLNWSLCDSKVLEIPDHARIP